MARPFNVGVRFRPNPNLATTIREDLFARVQEVFEMDIKKEAQSLSPVRKVKRKAGKRWFPGGTNKRSIDVEVKQSPMGVHAAIFTQSGYGGYLELGTSKMPARPYLFPAFMKYKALLAKLVRPKGPKGPNQGTTIRTEGYEPQP